MTEFGIINKARQRGGELLRRRRFQPYVIQRRTGQRTFPFLISDPTAQAWYGNDQATTWPETEFLEANVVTPGDLVLEIGAHHGAATIPLAGMVGPTGRVVAFEPSSLNVATLARNMLLSHLSNVDVEHAAVGAQAGSLKMFKKSNASVTQGWAGAVNYLFGVEKVPVVTIDGWVARTGRVPDVLKIDVEGFEAEVLKGARETLLAAPKLAVEIHTEVLHRYGTSVQEILDLIGVDRYKTWVQWDDETDPRPWGGEPIGHRVHLFAV